MVDSRHDKTATFSMQSVLLVALETVFTFIYRHDGKIRALSSPLVNQGLVLHCHTRFPDSDFFIRFSSDGVLFDREAPDQLTPHLILRTSLLELFNILILGRTQQISSLQLMGDERLVPQVRGLLQQLSVPALAQDWWQQLGGDDKPSIKPRKRRSHRELVQLVNEQRRQIKVLDLQVRHSQHEVRRYQSHVKAFKRWLIIVSVLLIAALSWIGWLYYQY